MSEELQELQRRVAVNQSRFRQLNEAIEERHESSAFIEFLCECAQKTCEQPIGLTVDEYEEVRHVPTHFIVVPGHVVPQADRVVRETTRYQVVEKIGDAAKVATKLDPRHSASD